LAQTTHNADETNGGGEEGGGCMIDFREMGFRDCVFDVSNYLVNEEQMDFQDPFRLRLVSYLKCFTSNQQDHQQKQQQQQQTDAATTQGAATNQAPLIENFFLKIFRNFYKS
jgi:hypothetical protein